MTKRTVVILIISVLLVLLVTVFYICQDLIDIARGELVTSYYGLK